MATQFKTLVELACSTPAAGATLEAAAAHSLRIEAETQTLVCLIERGRHLFPLFTDLPCCGFSGPLYANYLPSQVRTAEDILALTREMKAMWLFGALRKLGEGEEEDGMGVDSEAVAALIRGILSTKGEVTE